MVCLVKDMKLGRKPVLPVEVEEKLVEYCIEMDRKFFRLTKWGVCCLVFEVAEINKLPIPFNPEKEATSKKRFHAFMKCHPYLSLQTPPSTTADQILKFIKVNVKRFFGLYDEKLDRLVLKNDPRRIYEGASITTETSSTKCFIIYSDSRTEQFLLT